MELIKELKASCISALNKAKVKFVIHKYAKAKLKNSFTLINHTFYTYIASKL